METNRFNPNRVEDWPQAFLIPLRQQDDRTIKIEQFLTLGRDPGNTLMVDDPFVSQRHLRIEKRGERFLLRDLQSRNGTVINGTRVIEAYLNNNDQIAIGESFYLFSKYQAPNQDLTSKNIDWNEQLKRLPAFAHTDFTVLIMGPSGSGKEILASWIHQHSQRRGKPFITINCSALSEGLIESELFGHKRGAFTGATNDRKGAFEAARGGTLFLDEIGDLPMDLQPKLLRALENREIRPVGSDRTIKTDVRIVAATHKNLREKVMTGEFREDLYHRLNICRLCPPSLVERMEDFETLLYNIAKENRVGFSYMAVEKLKNHTWPGNIRELKHTIMRAAAYFPGKRITESDVDSLIEADKPSSTPVVESQELPPMKFIERNLIEQKLKLHNGNQRRVAEELRMPKSTLHDKIKYYGLNPKIYKKRGKAIS